MTGEWEALMDEVQSSLKPLPKPVYLPARLSGASQTDADMLKSFGKVSLTSVSRSSALVRCPTANRYPPAVGRGSGP